MRKGFIYDEKDPILREVYYAGYDEVLDDFVSNKFILIDHKREITKEFNQFEYSSFVSSLTIKDNGQHLWVADGDGSSKRFQEYIKHPSISEKDKATLRES